MKKKKPLSKRTKTLSLGEYMDHVFDHPFFHPSPFKSFAGLFEPMRMPSFEGIEMPRVNMSETKTLIKVEVEVPGCEAKDIDVHVEDDVLTIHAEKKEEKEEKKEKKHYYYKESSYQEFHRRIPLPGNIDTDKAKTKVKDGLLIVSFPKKKAAKGKRKKVKVNKK